MLFDKTHNLLLRINLKVVKKKKIRNNIMYLISDKKKSYWLSTLFTLINF